MAKLDQAAEKRFNNELYADKHKKSADEDSDKVKEQKRRGGKFGNWCRNIGHPASCSCAY